MPERHLYISETEEWPVFVINEDVEVEPGGPSTVTLTDEEFADYKRVRAEYDAWQDRLAPPDAAAAD